MVRFALPAALAGLLIAAPAFAGQQTVRVATGDLDLISADGQQRLAHRVKRASQRVCGIPHATTLLEKTASKKCQRRALDESRPAIDLALERSRQRGQLLASDQSGSVSARAAAR